MSVITRERAEQILAELVAIPSVNPMDRPYTGTVPVERAVIEYLEALLTPYGVAMTRQAVSATHENLLVTLPGEASGPATLFEAHIDTVPAEDWPDRAFTPRVEGDRLYGRGACDDKASLTAMLLAVIDLLESGSRPPQPVLLLAAGDEEHGQSGIACFREAGIDIARGIFGEPTNLAPIVQHKGVLRWDITVHGKSAHSSRPELGLNAIDGAVAVIGALQAHQEALQRDYTSPLLTGPTLTVTMIHGGRIRNAVPDECTLSVDFRVPPGMALEAAHAAVVDQVSRLGWQVTHHPPQAAAPALNTPPDHPFAQQVLAICQRHAGSGIRLEGAPYGTDAAWIADRAPALVLGPGSIATAHAVDEHVDLNEVVTCARIYREILLANPLP